MVKQRLPHAGLASLLLIFLLSTQALSQAQPARVRSVTFPGRTTISQRKLLEVAELRIGDDWTPKVAADVHARLLAWPYIARVELPRTLNQAAGLVDVELEIAESPVLGSVSFSGNDALSEKTLRKAVPLKVGQPYRASAVRETEEGLELAYHRDGFLLAAVRGVVTVRGRNRRYVDFQIDEGRRIYLQHVQLLGAEQVSARDALSGLANQPRRLFGFLSRGYYQPDQIRMDLFRVEQFYIHRGYLEVKVEMEELKFNRKKTEVKLSLRVEEGRRWGFDGVRLEGNELLPTSLLQRILDVPAGGYYDKIALDLGIQRLSRFYQERTGLLPEIQIAVPDLDFERARVRVVLKIVEHSHLLTEKISIGGLDRTRERVVRQLLKLDPGKPYTITAQQDSLENIAKRGLFKNAEALVASIAPEDSLIRDSIAVTNQPDRPERIVTKEVEFVVEEDELYGEVEVGGGASSGAGEVAYARVTHRNFDLLRLPLSLAEWNGAFTGGGQTIEFVAIPGSVESNYGARFEEPYFFRSDLALSLAGGGSILARHTYDENHLRGEAQVKKFFDDEHRGWIGLSYVADNVNIRNLDIDAPFLVQTDRGHTFLGYPRLALGWDGTTRDFFAGPSGFSVNGEVDLADRASGSEEKFVRTRVSAEYGLGLFDRRPDYQHKLYIGIQFGWLEGRDGDNTHIAERFYLGGPRSFPGFHYRRVGPRQGREPVGGEGIYHGFVQYSVPVVWREIRLFSRFDWGDNEPRFSRLSTGRIRTAAGGGVQIRIRTPVFTTDMPVNFYFMQALTSERGDREQFFSFTLGVAF